MTGRAFRIRRIRANRSKPGLARQHLTAVGAAATVGNASVDGAALGSQELVFRPGTVRAGTFHFPIGTAGSTTLVLQTVLPPLLHVGGRSHLRIEGGTHNTHAPPFDFIEKAFVPLINRMGPHIALHLERRGFYPAGGGAFEVDIDGGPLQRLDLDERLDLPRIRARAIVIKLPRHIGERELKVATERLAIDSATIDEGFGGPSPGNAFHIEIESDQLTEVMTGFGERGLAAERVAEAAVAEATAYLDDTAAVGEHLADQLLIPMALAGGGSMVTVTPSLHTRTNIDVIRTFLDVDVRVTPHGGVWRIEVGQAGAIGRSPFPDRPTG